LRQARYWLRCTRQKFERAPLGLKFLAAFSLPMLALVWLSVSIGLDRYGTVRKTEQLRSITHLATKTGSLVGQLQRERGMSSVFLESQGQLFADKLQNTRQSTNTHLERLKEQLAKTRYPVTHSTFFQNVRLLAGALIDNDLTKIRSRIDGNQISAHDASGTFTQYILGFNEQISQLSGFTSHNGIGRTLNAFFIMNRLRESVGKERELVSVALVNRSLTEDQLRQLTNLAGQQQTLITGLLSQTDASNIYHKLKTKTSAEGFRNQLISAPDKPAVLLDMSPGDWFSLRTERLDQISEVENRLSQDVLDATHTLLDDARQDLWRYLTVSSLMLLAGAILTFLLFRQIQSGLLLTHAVLKHTHDRITVTDARARIIEVNNAFERVSGYQRSEALGRNPSILNSGHQDNSFYRELWESLQAHDKWQGEIWNRRKNGELFAELTTINAVRDKHGVVRNYVAVSSEITERAHEHQRQLEHKAYHDPLTGLPNQMLARDRLEQACKAAKRSSRQLIVACIDLDNFRTINDQYGHSSGDLLLALVARRLNGRLQEGDTLARTGGDEFLVIVEGCYSSSAIREVLVELQQELSGPFQLPQSLVTVTASIGATVFPDDTDDADALIRHATQALHQSKDFGRARVSWFDPQVGRKQNALADLIRELETAIKNNELCLFYQPKVNMATGQVLGLEALLRWQHPERGLVPPGQFLPQLEQHPFSITVGNWVIETAVAQLLAWQARGTSMRISINVNALQLLDSDFVKILEQQLRRHPELNPGNLDLEILESAAISDINRAAEVLRECQNLGIGVSLDDFGTGYAALEYLKRLPAETLKIDQTFIREMHRDSGDRAIVRGIIGLADAFGFGVIAEGVETEKQGCMLIELGCPNAQGYHIAKPMPAEMVEDWVAGWQPPLTWQRYSFDLQETLTT